MPSPSAVSKTDNTDDASKNTVTLNNFDHKIGSLIESISRMENSIQNLQEKSHTWSIFQHHIESWNDGLRILENKLDILKRSHEEQQGQLNQLELTLSMTHDTPPIMDEIKDILKRDRGIQMETTTKVNAVLRQLQNLQKDLQKEKNSTASTSHASHGKKKGNIIISSQDLVPPASSSLFCNSTHKIEQRLSTIAHQMVHQKDLKQLHSVEKRMAKSLEGLTQSITQALDRQEELTTRLQKSNECCYSLSSELTTFTESSDILLKRIERLINNVNEKLTKLEQNHEEIEENNKENSDEDEQEQDSTNPHSDLFSDEIEGNETSKEETEIDNGEDDMSYGIEEYRTELFEVDVGKVLKF